VQKWYKREDTLHLLLSVCESRTGTDRYDLCFLPCGSQTVTVCCVEIEIHVGRNSTKSTSVEIYIGRNSTVLPSLRQQKFSKFYDFRNIQCYFGKNLHW